MDAKPTRSTRRKEAVSKTDQPGSAGQVQSLIRGLTLLEHLAGSDQGLLLTDLAQRVGLAASTTHRLLGTLEQLQFVRQDRELGLWSIGVKAFTVGAAFRGTRNVVNFARPYLLRLRDESGETANLALLDDDAAVFIAQVESREMMRMLARIGGRGPLHASGVGKALLAALSEAEVDAIVRRRGLTKYTPSTIDQPERLRIELDETRRRGFSIDWEEHAVGLHCVAATIHDEFGAPLAAISVSGPKVRLPAERLIEAGLLVARAAAEITRALGGVLPQRPE